MALTYFVAAVVLMAGIIAAIYGVRILRRERIHIRVFESKVLKLVADLEKEVQP